MEEDALSYESKISAISRHTNYDIHIEGEGLLELDFEDGEDPRDKLRFVKEDTIARYRDPSRQIIEETPEELSQESRPTVDLSRYMLTEKDSIEPSYTNLVLPYAAVCRQRYHKAQIKMEKQFIKEIKLHETFQSKGLDGVRIHREFCKSIIKYPKPSELVRLSRKQKEKIEAILEREY